MKCYVCHQPLDGIHVPNGICYIGTVLRGHCAPTTIRPWQPGDDDTPTDIIKVESDPNGIAAHTPGAKLDAGKLRPWLCIAGFANALEAVAQVTTKGAIKYTPNGWTHVENGPERYMEAFGRHLLKLGTGEVVDSDTGCLHKAQMVWNLLAALELELRAERST